jgi:hypothetical protein
VSAAYEGLNAPLVLWYLFFIYTYAAVETDSIYKKGVGECQKEAATPYTTNNKRKHSRNSDAF